MGRGVDAAFEAIGLRTVGLRDPSVSPAASLDESHQHVVESNGARLGPAHAAQVLDPPIVGARVVARPESAFAERDVRRLPVQETAERVDPGAQLFKRRQPLSVEESSELVARSEAGIVREYLHRTNLAIASDEGAQNLVAER